MPATVTQLELQLTGDGSGAQAALRQVDAGINRVGSSAQGATQKTSTLLERIRAANREARSGGERDIERLLRGGGALGLATLAAHELESLGEGFRKAVSDALVSGQSVGHAFGQGLVGAIENIPVVGAVYKTITSLESAWADASAIAARQAGNTDWLSLASEETRARIAAEDEKLNAETLARAHAFAVKIREAGMRGTKLQLAQIDEDYKARFQKIAENEAKARNNGDTLGVNAAQQERRLGEQAEAVDKARVRQEALDRLRDLRRETDETNHDAFSEDREHALRDNGYVAGAETERIRREAQDRVNRLTEEANKAKREHPEAQEAIDDARDAKVAEVQQKALRDVHAAEEAETERHAARSYELAKTVGDAEHRARLESLRAAKQDRDADLEDARFHHQEQLQEIDEAARKGKYHQSPAVQREVDDAAARQRAAADAEFAADQKRADVEEKRRVDERLEHQRSVDRQIREMHASAVESQARQGGEGSRQAKLESERLAIAGRYQDRLEEIARIQRDDKATQEQKNQASREAIELRKQAARDLALVGLEKAPTASAKSEYGGYLTGVAERAQARYDQQAENERRSRLAAADASLLPGNPAPAAADAARRDARPHPNAGNAWRGDPAAIGNPWRKPHAAHDTAAAKASQHAEATARGVDQTNSLLAQIVQLLGAPGEEILPRK